MGRRSSCTRAHVAYSHSAKPNAGCFGHSHHFLQVACLRHLCVPPPHFSMTGVVPPSLAGPFKHVDVLTQ
eukprot:3725921-Prymnesium_polylepis.1